MNFATWPFLQFLHLFVRLLNAYCHGVGPPVMESRWSARFQGILIRLLPSLFAGRVINPSCSLPPSRARPQRNWVYPWPSIRRPSGQDFKSILPRLPKTQKLQDILSLFKAVKTSSRTLGNLRNFSGSFRFQNLGTWGSASSFWSQRWTHNSSLKMTALQDSQGDLTAPGLGLGNILAACASHRAPFVRMYITSECKVFLVLFV